MDFKDRDNNILKAEHIPTWVFEWYDRFYTHYNTRRSQRNLDDFWTLSILVEALSCVMTCTYYGVPFTTRECTLLHQPMLSEQAGQLSQVLATTAISQLALPEVRPVHVDDLLEARTALRDELLGFRAGILNLTWLLHQQVKGANDLAEIRREADMLVNTKIKAAVMSLENRMRQHENKRVRRMLFGTGRVLVDAAKMFLLGGWQEKLVAGGKALLQTATEIDGPKPPEDQVATYLYTLKRRLKS
jgi:hypothetical protein